jgi:hypothetical protein
VTPVSTLRRACCYAIRIVVLRLCLSHRRKQIPLPCRDPRFHLIHLHRWHHLKRWVAASPARQPNKVLHVYISQPSRETRSEKRALPAFDSAVLTLSIPPGTKFGDNSVSIFDVVLTKSTKKDNDKEKEKETSRPNLPVRQPICGYVRLARQVVLFALLLLRFHDLCSTWFRRRRPSGQRGFLAIAHSLPRQRLRPPLPLHDRWRNIHRLPSRHPQHDPTVGVLVLIQATGRSTLGLLTVTYSRLQ